MPSTDKLQRWESEWRKSLPKYAEQELLGIFPEIKTQLPSILQRLNTNELMIKTKIRLNLAKLKSKKTDELSYWFWREWIKEKYKPELSSIIAQKGRLERMILLSQPSTAINTKKQMLLNDQKIDLARTTPIEQFISTPQQQLGNRIKTTCPLHEDKTPSFVIYKETNSCWCFGCNQGGDVIQLIRLLYGYSFPQAINYLTNQTNMKQYEPTKQSN